MDKKKRRELSEEYNLQVCYPKVALEWHPILNGNTKPHEVYPRSGKKYWWLCPKGDEYLAAVNKRTREKNPTGCPVCAGKKVTLANCLATTHPHLIEEWDYEKNGDKTPYNVVAGSNDKVHWICSHCKTSFRAMIAKRALRNQGCRKCSVGTSFPEQFLCYCLERLLGKDDVFNRQMLGDLEADIYIRSINTTVEYCGRAHHKNSKGDNIKTQKFQEHGIKVIQIRENGCGPLLAKPFAVITSYYTNTKKEALLPVIKELVLVIFKILNKNDSLKAKNFFDDAQKFLMELDIKELSPTIHARIRASRKPIVPFIYERRDLLEYWDFSKNKHVKPHDLSKSSTVVVNWKCPKGHEWQESILTQVKRKTVCTKCKSLAETHPHIAKELVDERYTAYDLSFGSEREVMWKCSDCENLYSMPVYQKVKRKKCPICKNTG